MPSSAPMEGAVRCSANYTPLTPISFLERAASVYADRAALVAGGGRAARTWQETRARCLRLAAALAGLGVARHDVVAIFAQNIPAVCELQFGIPMAGAVICALNFRLDSAMASVLLQHSEAKVIFVDHELFNAVQEALRLMSNAGAGPPLVVLIKDDAESPPGADVNATIQLDYEYESFLRNGSPDFEIRWPVDENDPIALNYTSGTTSRPKGVIYSHRATYLNAIATVLLNDMTAMPVYLWTVPMFHCNGWCLVWGLAAQGGMNICIRKVSAKAIFDNIARHKVTHMGGAPTVLNMIVNATADEQKPLPGRVTVMTGGAPPPPQVLFKMEELGFLVIHSYGLTETIGPATYCAWRPEWDGLPPEQRAKIKARQGLHHLGLEVDIKDPVTMRNVPADEKTMGEVMFRGNTIMSGYYKDLKATQESLAGGWYRSGDLAVRHADGYIKLKDRSKDIIISGGENISTIEVESVLFSHPAVLDAAVVGRPDDYWGETPCAFVTLKEDTADATAAEIIAFCRARLPHYMAPRTVVFQELPKTSTGKTQKFVLREQAKAMGSLPRPAGSGSKL